MFPFYFASDTKTDCIYIFSEDSKNRIILCRVLFAICYLKVSTKWKMEKLLRKNANLFYVFAYFLGKFKQPWNILSVSLKKFAICYLLQPDVGQIQNRKWKHYCQKNANVSAAYFWTCYYIKFKPNHENMYKEYCDCSISHSNI